MKGSDTVKVNKMKGIAVSPGIIIGKARLVERSRMKLYYQYLISDEHVNRELERFKDALKITQEQILNLKNRMPEQIKKHAFIFDAQAMILNDSMLCDSTINSILLEKINAEWAFKKSIQKIQQLFDQIDDEYIKERIKDIEIVAERVMRNLAGKEQESLAEINEPVIIVTHDLSPGDTCEMNSGNVMGFVTDVGGRTSHTAIMAKALQIPAVFGLESATHKIQDGTLLIVDGNSGEVIIEPDEETRSFYQEKQLQQEKFESSILRVSHLPAETVDGCKITLKANIEFLEEVTVAKDYGAEGIGLYRTEFLYLRCKGIPDEEDLFEDYKKVAEMISPAPVTIRTVDLGEDKFSSDLELARGMNPSLGLRAIRFCLKEPEIFMRQLRAILRASAHGNVRIMFPMISGLQEVLDAKSILEEAKADLDHKGLGYDREIKVGVMIEIPSAVTVADLLARHVDFFSIGTNDLIQYALAIDRINEHVAFMYQPFHPALLRMLAQVVKAARDAGINVALCGEMAGDLLCTKILLALGIDELSMNARNIPAVKKIIRSISMAESQADLKEILELDTARKVREFLIRKMSPLIPDLEEKGFYG